MKIALLCAMAFVTLSSLPLVSHHGSAVAQGNTAAQIRTSVGISRAPATQTTTASVVKKLDVKSTNGKGMAAAASRSAQ